MAKPQPGSPHGRCEIKPRSAGDLYVGPHRNRLWCTSILKFILKLRRLPEQFLESVDLAYNRLYEAIRSRGCAA